MTDVIYVEDDETEALLFQLGLKTRGIHVLPVSDLVPNDAHLLLAPPYHAAGAVFVDLWIRTTSGIDLCRALREAGDQRPLFLVTAANNPAPALLDQWGIHYLQKPLDFNHVAELIRQSAAR